MHKICAPDSAVAPPPDSLTRAATPLRIAEVRPPRALGFPSARGRKAELCSAATVYNINWINRVGGSGPVSPHGIIRPAHLPRLDDDDVCGLARLHAAAARRLPRRAMLYLVADRPEAKADETSIRARQNNCHKRGYASRLCRRNIEMTPPLQDRGDTPRVPPLIGRFGTLIGENTPLFVGIAPAS